FSECFGVFASESTPAERIVLRAYNKQRYYLNDLPLHHSQKVIGRGENYTDFEYYIRPTIDFCGHILSLANQLKVIYPQSLADRIRQMAMDTLEMYGMEVGEARDN
ncbi:MAG: WYL domain-containing protein, partial [Prevotella sp.]|nr:WYL domain-containing protein [Prevotella sp.]